jgi:uncharacterized spore protein YtfJ
VAKDGKGKRRSRTTPEAPLAVVGEALPPTPPWQRAVGRLTGARMSFGKPVQAHGHVVIPVATLRTFGGLGFGSGTPGEPSPGDASPNPSPGDGSGGGGGGLVDARPVGFIDIGPDGVRYQPIEVPEPARRASTTALAALAIVVAARLLGGPLRQRANGLRRRRPTALPWPVQSLRR